MDKTKEIEPEMELAGKSFCFSKLNFVKFVNKAKKITTNY